MGNNAIALVHLHLTDADAAARAPGHRVVAAIDEPALVALLEKGPDRVVVFLRHREVAAPLVSRLFPVLLAVPIHPVAEANGLLRLNLGELVHAFLAALHELIDA